MPAPLAPCPGCSRHVLRSAHTCPFCASPLQADATGVHVDEEPPRVSRSTLLLASAAMVAGCNLTSAPTPAYGATPPPRVDAAVAPMPLAMPAYGLPPPIEAPTPPTPPQVDAAAPVDAHAPSHRRARPQRRDVVPVPAYGVPPHRDPDLKP